MKEKSYEELIRLMLEKTALISAGTTALRNQGAKGVVKSAQEYLKKTKPEIFLQKTEEEFIDKLDSVTEKLKNSFPEGAKNWGAARKVLNLYLREIFYNRYLFEYYKFSKLEYWLEVPLDSFVAIGLKKEFESCPTWKGLKYLSQRDSLKYQEFANVLASKKNLARVHLDIYLWRGIGKNNLK